MIEKMNILHLSRVLSCCFFHVYMFVPTMTTRFRLVMSQFIPFLRLAVLVLCHPWYYVSREKVKKYYRY